MPVLECSVCLENFENEDTYQSHLQYHEHRATELLQELKECLHHISAQPRLINAHTSPTLLSPSISPPVSKHSHSWVCPHPDCVGKPKKVSFKRRKDLVRHVEAHQDCEEECLFCGTKILRVRKYFTHYDMCPIRIEQRRSGIMSREKDKEMWNKRRALHEATDLWLEEMLHSAAGDIATRRRRKVAASVIKNRATSNDAHAHCHSRSSPDHGQPRLDANTIQPDMTCLNRSQTNRLEANPDANTTTISAFSSMNNLLQEMDVGRMAILPMFDLSPIPNPSLLPRAPVVTSYTMDEPYHITSGYQFTGSGVNHLTNGPEPDPYLPLGNHPGAVPRFEG